MKGNILIKIIWGVNSNISSLHLSGRKFVGKMFLDSLLLPFF